MISQHGNRVRAADPADRLPRRVPGRGAVGGARPAPQAGVPAAPALAAQPRPAGASTRWSCGCWRPAPRSGWPSPRSPTAGGSPTCSPCRPGSRSRSRCAARSDHLLPARGLSTPSPPCGVCIACITPISTSTSRRARASIRSRSWSPPASSSRPWPPSARPRSPCWSSRCCSTPPRCSTTPTSACRHASTGAAPGGRHARHASRPPFHPSPGDEQQLRLQPAVVGPALRHLPRPARAGHEAMTIGIDAFRSPEDLRLDRLLVQPFRDTPGEYPIDRRPDPARGEAR